MLLCYWKALEPDWARPIIHKILDWSTFYLTQIIKNFIYLSQCEPEIFPDQIEKDHDANKMSDQTIAVAMRVMTHFEQRGFNLEILNIFFPKINEDLGGDFT